MSRLFDVYIAVDWSARSMPSPRRPTKDAIWVGEAPASEKKDGAPIIQDSYWSTRSACRLYLRDQLLHHMSAQRRVFLGFDFAFGYPGGFAKALNLQGDFPAWCNTWNEITRCIRDDESNHNNRFEVAAAFNERCGGPADGPFWGCPVDCVLPTLKMKSPAQGYPFRVAADCALNRLRWTDKIVRGVQPVWKILGSGSVGGQTLVGIPTVCKLRDDPLLAPVSSVWPFETGFTPSPTPHSGPFILHAEIWPRVAPNIYDPTLTVPDQAQVHAVVRWLRELDTAGQLHELFVQPAGLTPEIAKICIEEEGWILGGGLRA